jgi:hypothetical protein
MPEIMMLCETKVLFLGQGFRELLQNVALSTKGLDTEGMTYDAEITIRLYVLF